MNERAKQERIKHMAVSFRPPSIDWPAATIFNVAATAVDKRAPWNLKLLQPQVPRLSLQNGSMRLLSASFALCCLLRRACGVHYDRDVTARQFPTRAGKERIVMENLLHWRCLIPMGSAN